MNINTSVYQNLAAKKKTLADLHIKEKAADKTK